jgi:GTP cyclohydrolase I
MNAPLKALNFEDPIAPHVRAMLEELGEDPRREGLANTPERCAKAMRYLAGGYASAVASVVGNGVFAAEGEGAVVVRDIEFHSLCEHHLLPFYGRVHVGYLPAQRIIGFSKIPRLVDLFARRFQVQERLTQQVAEPHASHRAERDTAAVEWRGMRQSEYCGAAPQDPDLTAKRG